MNREQYRKELTELLNENREILDEGLLTLLKAIGRGLMGKAKGAGKWLSDAWKGDLEPWSQLAKEFDKDPEGSADELKGMLKKAGGSKGLAQFDAAAEKLGGEEAEALDDLIDTPADKDDKKGAEAGVSIVKGTESEETIPLYKGKKGVGLRSYLDKNLSVSPQVKNLILKFVKLQLKSQGFKIAEGKLEEAVDRILLEKGKIQVGDRFVYTSKKGKESIKQIVDAPSSPGFEKGVTVDPNTCDPKKGQDPEGQLLSTKKLTEPADDTCPNPNQLKRAAQKDEPSAPEALRASDKEDKKEKNKKTSGSVKLPKAPEPGSVQGINLFKGKKGAGLQSLLAMNKRALDLDSQQITQILKKLKPWFRKKGLQVNEAKLQKILMERLRK